MSHTQIMVGTVRDVLSDLNGAVVNSYEIAVVGMTTRA